MHTSGQVSFPLTKLFQIDGSKRSAHSNAYFFGFWTPTERAHCNSLEWQLHRRDRSHPKKSMQSEDI